MIYIPLSGGGTIGARSISGDKSDKDTQDKTGSDKTSTSDIKTSTGSTEAETQTITVGKTASDAKTSASTSPSTTPTPASPDTVTLSPAASTALEQANPQMAIARRISDLSVRLSSLMTEPKEKIGIIDELALLKAYPQIASFMTTTPEAYWGREGMSKVAEHAIDTLSSTASQTPTIGQAPTPGQEGGVYDWSDRSPVDAFNALTSIAEHGERLPQNIRGKAIDVLFSLGAKSIGQDTTGVSSRDRMRAGALRSTISSVSGNRNIGSEERIALLDRYFSSNPDSAMSIMGGLYNDESLRPAILAKYETYMKSGSPTASETVIAMLEDKSVNPEFRSMMMGQMMKNDPAHAVAFLKSKAALLGFLPSFGILPSKTFLEMYTTDPSIPKAGRDELLTAFADYCEKSGDAAGQRLMASISDKHPDMTIFASRKASQGISRRGQA